MYRASIYHDKSRHYIQTTKLVILARIVVFIGLCNIQCPLGVYDTKMFMLRGCQNHTIYYYYKNALL